MNRIATHALAAALLLCLAIAAPVHAQDASDTSEAAASEDAGWSPDDPGSSAVEEDFDGSDASETDVDAASTEDAADSEGSDDSQAAASTRATEQQSAGRQIKHQLKRLLMGVLLPAVERRLAKASGESEPASEDTEPSPQDP